LLIGQETMLDNGYSTYRLPRAWHHECRAFVKSQSRDGKIKCAEVCPLERRGLRRHVLVGGLRDATLRFYPEPDQALRVFDKTPDAEGKVPYAVEVPYTQDSDATGRYVEITDFTGDLVFAW
jgi:hypothetical protein